MNQSQNAYQQPLPPQPPQHHDPRPSQRPRSKSGFSFRSQKSHESSGSAPKVELFETAREKAGRRLSTKADPRLAMSEAEPSAVASDHSSLLAPLRGIQHRDTNGLPIADPDRSNPTRSRWERPLDTIRSFEAAIDGNYSRKSGRPDPPDSRRTSYYGGSTMGTPRTHQDNGYGGRGGYGNGGQSKPDGYYDNNYNNNGYQPNRARYPRNGESTLNNGAGVYPPNGNQQSYETVTTASGSGSSGEPQGYFTDPSSDNSSIDRVPQFAKPEYGSQPSGQHNGGNSYGGYPSVYNQQYVAGGAPPGNQTNGNQSQNGPPPPLPKMESAPSRTPIKLGKSADGPASYEAVRPVTEKRKSWFGKRFGKA